MDCLFCKIAAKEINSNIVYEDEKIIAFLDNNPVNPGHVLIVPKIHAEHLPELPDEYSAPVMTVIKKVMQAIMKQPGVDGVNILQNNYSAAGQVIPHVHFHVIPRKTGDGHRHWPGVAYNEGQASEVADKIKEAIV
jgi:histidine triad (HIT) family protein